MGVAFPGGPMTNWFPYHKRTKVNIVCSYGLIILKVRAMRCSDKTRDVVDCMAASYVCSALAPYL